MQIQVDLSITRCKERLTIVMDPGSTIKDLLQILQIDNSDEYLYIINGKNKFSNCILQNEDFIQILPLLAGG